MPSWAGSRTAISSALLQPLHGRKSGDGYSGRRGHIGVPFFVRTQDTQRGVTPFCHTLYFFLPTPLSAQRAPDFYIPTARASGCQIHPQGKTERIRKPDADLMMQPTKRPQVRVG